MMRTNYLLGYNLLGDGIILDKDLPSVKNLELKARILKIFYPFLSKTNKEKLKLQFSNLNEICFVVEEFNNCFLKHGWCLYDSMNTKVAVEAINAYLESGLFAGEAVLIDYYTNGIKGHEQFLLQRGSVLYKRKELIDLALEDHYAGRYFASVPQFLAIIDGVINDFTKSKGFFASGTDVTAWDCLVGCDDGLQQLQIIFNSKRTQTTSEEIRIPYRNGIMHGRDLNYGNVYVSCKCIALLAAISDWMIMSNSEDKRKQDYEKEQNPQPLKESIKKLNKVKRDKQRLEKWKARTIVVGKDIPKQPNFEDCRNYQYLVPVICFFEAWSNKNYGDMAKCLKNMIYGGQTINSRAGECRRLFSSKELISYKILEIVEIGIINTEMAIEVIWKEDNTVKNEIIKLASIYTATDGKFGLPESVDGEWELYRRDIGSLLD